MNIFLLNQYYAPDEAATAQLLSDLGESLARSGHRVTAICGDRAYADARRRYPQEEAIAGVRVRRVRTTAFGRAQAAGRMIDYVFYVSGALMVMIRSERPHVVLTLTTPPMLALLASLVGRLRGAKCALWSMDVYPDLLYAVGGIRERSLTGKVLRLLSAATLRSQAAVVALGESMAGRLRSTGACRIEVIHNWSDEDAIVPIRSEESRLREQWGWGDRFVVLYSGNLGLTHEFDTVLAAADRLRDDARILFAFVGAGPRLSYVERRREELQLPNVDIRHPVSRDLLAQNLAAGDVHLITLQPAVPGLVVPSKIYGILAAGRPTLYVGPSAGEVFDIITTGHCGTRVANGDAEALAAAIRRYRDDSATRAEEGIRARQLFESRFTKSRGVAQFRVLLESLYEEKSLLTVAVRPR